MEPIVDSNIYNTMVGFDYYNFPQDQEVSPPFYPNIFVPPTELQPNVKEEEVVDVEVEEEEAPKKSNKRKGKQTRQHCKVKLYNIVMDCLNNSEHSSIMKWLSEDKDNKFFQLNWDKFVEHYRNRGKSTAQETNIKNRFTRKSNGFKKAEGKVADTGYDSVYYHSNWDAEPPPKKQRLASPTHNQPSVQSPIQYPQSTFITGSGGVQTDVFQLIKYPTIQHPPIQHIPIQHLQYQTIQHPQVQYPPLQHSSVQYPSLQHTQVQYPQIQHPPVHQPVQHQPVQHQPVQHQPVQHQPVQHQPVQHQQVQHQPVQHQPVQLQPVQLQPVQHPPVQHIPPPTPPLPVDYSLNQHPPVQHSPVQHIPPPTPPLPVDYPLSVDSNSLLKIIQDNDAVNLLIKPSNIIQGDQFMITDFLKRFKSDYRFQMTQVDFNNFYLLMESESSSTSITLDQFRDFLYRFGPLRQSLVKIRDFVSAGASKWFHGKISREKSEDLLKISFNNNPCTHFLLRTSLPIQKGTYLRDTYYIFAVSYIQEGKFYHTRVYTDLQGKICVPIELHNDGEKKFHSAFLSSLKEYLEETLKLRICDDCKPVSCPTFANLCEKDGNPLPLADEQEKTGNEGYFQLYIGDNSG